MSMNRLHNGYPRASPSNIWFRFAMLTLTLPQHLQANWQRGTTCALQSRCRAPRKNRPPFSHSYRYIHMAVSDTVRSRRKEPRSADPLLPPPPTPRTIDTTALCLRWPAQTAIQTWSQGFAGCSMPTQLPHQRIAQAFRLSIPHSPWRS